MRNQEALARQVVGAIRTVIGSEPAALHQPFFNGNELMIKSNQFVKLNINEILKDSSFYILEKRIENFSPIREGVG
jgi:hypothetical protein